MPSGNLVNSYSISQTKLADLIKLRSEDNDKWLVSALVANNLNHYYHNEALNFSSIEENKTGVGKADCLVRSLDGKKRKIFFGIGELKTVNGWPAGFTYFTIKLWKKNG